ncbi:glycosyltransferase [Secundilactobacillus malefermentans DSM 5705 = KCTC 3548]|nr:glycosyltransferase [Secundilactobacillus malefermentans DSM 5705 = KCTC 3548]
MEVMTQLQSNGKKMSILEERGNNLTIVVPCYNEEAVVEETTRQLSIILDKLSGEHLIGEGSRILYVNDGSQDRTWELIEMLMKKNKYVTGIKFSRNFGHQDALIAGLTVAKEHADMTITIDADLQDDVNAIPKMVQDYAEGKDVVYGVRNNRETDTWFKRTTAKLFYRLMAGFGVKMVPNHADFRLLSRRAMVGLLKYKEENLFLRGIVPLVGYPSSKVYYARKS